MLVVGLVILLFGGLFAWEIVRSGRIKQEISDNTQKLNEAKGAEKVIAKLEADIAVLKAETAMVDKRVPHQQKVPLDLIKELTLLASKYSVKKLEFKYIKNENATPAPGAAPVQISRNPLDDMGDDGGGNNQPVPQPAAVPNSLVGLAPLNVEMRFDCAYGKLVALVKDIMALQRIVYVEEVTIERVDKIVPFQRIKLKLVAYTFTQ